MIFPSTLFRVVLPNLLNTEFHSANVRVMEAFGYGRLTAERQE